LSTIKSVDCILYVDKGGIIERGSHDELVKMNGPYQRLYESQYEFLQGR